MFLSNNKQLSHIYSDGINCRKIAILGPSPLSIGGIAIHVSRVAKKFEREGNTVQFFDTTQEFKKRPFAYLFSLISFLWQNKPDIVYYHTLFLRSNLIEFLFIILLKKICKFKLVLVEHNYRYLFSKGKLYKKILNFLMKSVDEQILIGNMVEQIYHEQLVHRVQNVSVESPFLPPDISQEATIFASYDKELISFLSSHSPIIIANASQVILFNGVDIYGFDMCVELLHFLKKDSPNVGLIFALPRIGDENYFSHLKDNIKQKKIDSNWHFLIQNKEIWPLFRKATLFVRPTTIDTYGISVQEALLMGTPALASNVCIRPQGTVLFEPRNQEDFNGKARNILEDANHVNIK